MSYVGSPARPEPLIALFLGVFVGIFPALLSHPFMEWREGWATINLFKTVRTAPIWSTVLVATSVAFLMYCWRDIPAAGFSFATEAALSGRPERFRAVSAFCGFVYASRVSPRVSPREVSESVPESAT